MQFKKNQSNLIKDIIESTNTFKVKEKIETETGHKIIFEILDNPNKILIFEKRGNHRYWKMEEI